MRRSPELTLAALAATAMALLSGFVGDKGEAASKTPPPTFTSIERIATDPAVAKALGQVDASQEALVAGWIRIASTPSSSGHEGSRADLAESLMKAADLESVRRDATGNVIGVIPGADRKAKKAVFMAHMDTVARPGTEFTILRESGRLRGPGVRDDSSGLSAVLSAAGFVRRNGIKPPTDVIVVASVQEEVGLKGSQAWLGDNAADVGVFVAVDGYLGQISYAATTIIWTRMHFLAAGSHTLKSHENPSATLAAAKAIEAIYKIPLQRTPEDLESWINIGMLGGGDVPNAQARDAWFTVDLRSNDAVIAAGLEDKILDACWRAAADVGVSFQSEDLQRLKGARIEGNRDSVVARSAQLVLEHLGWREVILTPRGTADHNIAIQMGIPAIALGVTTGDGAHTPDEFADIAPYTTGVKQLILLMASPLV